MRTAALQADRKQTKSLKGQEARRTGRRLDPAIRPLLLVLVPYCICRLFFPVLHLILQKCLPNIFLFFQAPFSFAMKGTHDKMKKSKKSKDARSRTEARRQMSLIRFIIHTALHRHMLWRRTIKYLREK